MEGWLKIAIDSSWVIESVAPGVTPTSDGETVLSPGMNRAGSCFWTSLASSTVLHPATRARTTRGNKLFFMSILPYSAAARLPEREKNSVIRWKTA